MAKEIDRAYFETYAGSNANYNKDYELYSRVSDCIELIQKSAIPSPNRICILGSATGKVIQEFKKNLQVRIDSCEISSFAFQKTPPIYRRFVCNVDMREYVIELILRKKMYDLVFTNSLVYLEKQEVAWFIAQLAKVTKAVHFHSSFKGACCKDPYRKTLESYSWWNKKFTQAGFRPYSIKADSGRYLWVQC